VWLGKNQSGRRILFLYNIGEKAPWARGLQNDEITGKEQLVLRRKKHHRADSSRGEESRFSMKKGGAMTMTPAGLELKGGTLPGEEGGFFSLLGGRGKRCWALAPREPARLSYT